MSGATSIVDPRLAEADRLFEAGDVAAGVTIVVDVAGEDPSSADAQVRLLRLALAQRRIPEAAAIAQWLLCLEPTPDARALAALALHEARDERANEHAERAVADAPEGPTALAVAARVRLGSGDAPGAEEAARAALERSPHDVETRFTLATALGELDRTEEATRELIAVLEGNPLHLPSRFVLADLLATTGETDAAVGLLDDGLAALPEDAPEAVGELLRERRDLLAS